MESTFCPVWCIADRLARRGRSGPADLLPSGSRAAAHVISAAGR